MLYCHQLVPHHQGMAISKVSHFREALTSLHFCCNNISSQCRAWHPWHFAGSSGPHELAQHPYTAKSTPSTPSVAMPFVLRRCKSEIMLSMHRLHTRNIRTRTWPAIYALRILKSRSACNTTAGGPEHSQPKPGKQYSNGLMRLTKTS